MGFMKDQTGPGAGALLCFALAVRAGHLWFAVILQLFIFLFINSHFGLKNRFFI